MTVDGQYADDFEEKRRSCRLFHDGVPIGYGGVSLKFSLIDRICFVCGFHLIWNLSPSRVWLYLFGQGINVDPRAT